MYNDAAGQGGAADTLPPRLLTEAPTEGPAAGKVNGLAVMLPEYYAARGWDTSGSLTSETKKRLGL
jgi:aldehyde:ferredoxin oxidoreductase